MGLGGEFVEDIAEVREGLDVIHTYRGMRRVCLLWTRSVSQSRMKHVAGEHYVATASR